LPCIRDHFNAFGGELPAQLPENSSFQRHIGIYGYRTSLLHQFVTWPPAPIELAESLEQLRALWNGVDIKVLEAVESPPTGVDTLADLERIRALLA
jgi:3-deoxy-manno-octulosonate cytidylyltransferase (CMP-KDO synthetase)